MFRGHLDHASRRCIRGWAFGGSPDRSAQVHIHIDGELVARLTANQARDDLAAKLGSTRHGFELFLPGLCALRRHVISARLEGDDQELPNSPLIIEAADAFDDEVETSLSRLVAAADVPTLDRAALVMSELIDTILDRRVALACGFEARDLKYRWFAHRGAPAEAQPPSVAKRALVITPSDTPATEGFDGFLTMNRAVSLLRLGFEVAVAAADLAPLAAPQNVFLAAHRIELPRRPYTASVEELLRRQRGVLDVVLLVGRETARRYFALAEGLCPSARIVCAATAYDLASLDMASFDMGVAVDGSRRRRDDALSSDRHLTILPESKTGALDPKKIVVSWGEAARPSLTPFQRRAGIVVLDDPSSMAPILVDLLTAALDVVRGEVPAICIIWRHAPPPGCEMDACLGKETAIANIAERARVAVTLHATPAAYREVVACFAAGLPCVAPTQVLHDLGLPATQIAPDTSTADNLAAAILRLHEEAAHNANMRKRSLDEIDMRHAPADVDAALKLALRAARSTPRREIFAQSEGMEASEC